MPCLIMMPMWNPWLAALHFLLSLYSCSCSSFQCSLVSLTWIIPMPGAAGSCIRMIWLYLHFTCHLSLILILSWVVFFFFLLLSLAVFVPIHSWSPMPGAASNYLILIMLYLNEYRGRRRDWYKEMEWCQTHLKRNLSHTSLWLHPALRYITSFRCRYMLIHTVCVC